jgi:glutamate-1-semialdehyde 2,1-aminomutase
LGAMNEFLQQLDSPAILARYHELDRTWDERAAKLNERLREAAVNVRVANLSSVWTVRYLQPSQYNWMFQYYLRAQDLALSWVGTGRLIFSLDYTDADFAEVAERFVSAARQMQADGWWWPGSELTNKAIRRRVLQEMLRVRLRRPWDRSAVLAADRTELASKA